MTEYYLHNNSLIRVIDDRICQMWCPRDNEWEERIEYTTFRLYMDTKVKISTNRADILIKLKLLRPKYSSANVHGLHGGYAGYMGNHEQRLKIKRMV